MKKESKVTSAPSKYSGDRDAVTEQQGYQVSTTIFSLHYIEYLVSTASTLVTPG